MHSMKKKKKKARTFFPFYWDWVEVVDGCTTETVFTGLACMLSKWMCCALVYCPCQVENCCTWYSLFWLESAVHFQFVLAEYATFLHMC